MNVAKLAQRVCLDETSTPQSAASLRQNSIRTSWPPPCLHRCDTAYACRRWKQKILTQIRRVRFCIDWNYSHEAIVALRRDLAEISSVTENDSEE